MITGYEFLEKLYSAQEEYTETEERLYSTGDETLDELLERAFCDGYEYAQREYGNKDNKMKRRAWELSQALPTVAQFKQGPMGRTVPKDTRDYLSEFRKQNSSRDLALKGRSRDLATRHGKDINRIIGSQSTSNDYFGNTSSFSSGKKSAKRNEVKRRMLDNGYWNEYSDVSRALSNNLPEVFAR